MDTRQKNLILEAEKLILRKQLEEDRKILDYNQYRQTENRSEKFELVKAVRAAEAEEAKKTYIALYNLIHEINE